MNIDRRDFIRYSIAVVGGRSISGYAVKTTGTARKSVPIPLDSPFFCVDVAPLAGADATITDYSGFRYCPVVDALLLFGGGHAATPEDVVLRFPVVAPAWSSDYLATPTATMLETNPDGTYKYLRAGKFWQVPGQSPRIRPISRHTYSGFLWSSSIKRMILPMGSDGTYYGFTNETMGGNVAEYDPVTKTWEDAGVAGCSAPLAYCEDPISGLIIAQDQGQFRVYDPRQRKWIAVIELNAVPYFGYSNNLVYYPPNDRFYYIGRDVDPHVRHVRVWEYSFDRTGLRPNYTTPTDSNRGAPMTTNWRPSPPSGGKETGYAYDSTNQLIVGGMYGGFMLGFHPNANGSGEWRQHPAPGTTQQTFYCIDYVPRMNTHFAICPVEGKGKTTFAFRWDPAKATALKDPYLALVHATITPAAATLQDACMIGGTILLSKGVLFENEANAHPLQPVNIIGQGTQLISAGFEDKGIIITGVDTRLENIEISGATVSDGNGAGIRHEGGNVFLENVVLHDCQNGLLGPAHDDPGTVIINNCDVYNNGSGTGQTHGLYVGKIAEFTCSNSRFRATDIGHHIKSRAKVTNIQRCDVGTDFDGNESYNIDIPIGGDGLVADCTLRQGPKTDNSVMLNFGSEPNQYPGGSLKVYRSRFESTAGGIGIRNALPNVIADVQNCDFVGVETPIVGAHTRRNCTLNGASLPDVPPNRSDDSNRLNGTLHRRPNSSPQR